MAEPDLSKHDAHQDDGLTGGLTGGLAGAPRPVFQGDWARADGHARQAHMTLIAKWKSANPEASSATAEPSARHEGSADLSKATAQGAGDADQHASLEALRAIRDDKRALRSDRIRASEALLRSSSAQASSASDEVGLWVAMRTTLEALAPPDALRYLLGALEEEPTSDADADAFERVAVG